jgi:hypothetical protein
MMSSEIALLLAKDRAAERQREADRNRHHRPARGRSFGLLLRRRIQGRPSSR